jgi:repressor LexA
MELTRRQREVLNFVRTFVAEKGYPPSLREIGAHFRIYPRAVLDHLRALERKGWVKRQGAISRGLEILSLRGSRLGSERGGIGSRERTAGPVVREIPVLGRVAAGRPILAVEEAEETLSLPAEWAGEEGAFLLRVKGESMVPFLLPGDYVIVRPQPSAENGDVAVCLLGEEVTVKRFFKKAGKIELRPENNRWETMEVEEGSGRVQVLGKVTGLFRRC